MHFLITSNNKNVEPELNTIADKYQDKDKSILNNSLSGVKMKNYPRSQIPDMIRETDPPIMGQLDDGTWMNYKTLPLL